MRFHDYIEHLCINLNRVSDKTGIGRARLRYSTCPKNLSEEEIKKLKYVIGDWEEFEPGQE